MKPPEHFEIGESHASYRLAGRFVLQEAVALVSQAIAFAREQQIRKLLVDTTELTGFEPPGTLERFYMAEQFAREAQAFVIVVFVAREEMIDPQRFGITVARNRGLFSNVFTSRDEAVDWLLNPAAQ